MCAQSGSIGGNRSASGRLRRRPQRWEGSPVGGGLLSRLASPRAESTASAASHGSVSPVPVGIDARGELRAAAERARHVQAGSDAVRGVLDVQRALVSRLAATRKAHHAFLKRSMRKRANRLNEQDRIEDAALRNACSAIASTPAPGADIAPAPDCVVPLRMRLPLDAYLPRRVRGTPDVYDPADVIDALPPKRHRLGGPDAAADSSDGRESAVGRARARSPPVSEADELNNARGRRGPRSKKRNSGRYVESKSTEKRGRESNDKLDRREKKKRRKGRERDRVVERNAASSDDDNRRRRKNKSAHRGSSRVESSRAEKRRYRGGSASENDSRSRARSRSASPSRSSRHEHPMKRSRHDRDARHSDVENSDVAPRHRRKRGPPAVVSKKRRAAARSPVRSRTPSEISAQQVPVKEHTRTPSPSPTRSISPTNRTNSRTPSRPRTPADNGVVSGSQSEEDQVEIEEEEDEDEEETEGKRSVVRGAETDDDDVEVEVEEEEEIGNESGNAGNQAGLSSEEYSE